MYELRPYQQEAKDAVFREWDAGRRKTLIQLATGCGKTIIFSGIAKDEADAGRRSLILAHRGELLDQAREKLQLACGMSSALEKADCSSVGSSEPVTVGSVQTLANKKRLERFAPDYFDTVIVDEAHHVLSPTYKRVLDHFSSARVLGVTATPDRGDKRKLGEFFDSQAFEYPLPKAINDGWLCPIKAQLIPLDIDITDVGISQGDYAAGQIGSALDPYLLKIAELMPQYCRGRKTLVFLPLVDTSVRFSAMLRVNGLKAEEIDGNSSDRAEKLERFRTGETEVLCNSMLLTEGYDEPSVDCVVILRPTKIRSLYEQMVGRGTRKHPGKEDLLLLDFLWMTTRHDLCSPASLICKEEDQAEKMMQKLRGGGAYDIVESADQAERDVHAEREESLARVLAEMRTRKKKLVDPLQYIYSIAAEDLADYRPTFAWEFAPPSDAQRALIEKLGISTASIDNAGQASLIIDKLMKRQRLGLSTPKQIRCLENYGFMHVGTWSFSDASNLISAISANYWQVPYGISPASYVPRGART